MTEELQRQKTETNKMCVTTLQSYVGRIDALVLFKVHEKKRRFPCTYESCYMKVSLVAADVGQRCSLVKQDSKISAQVF